MRWKSIFCWVFATASVASAQTAQTYLTMTSDVTSTDGQVSVSGATVTFNAAGCSVAENITVTPQVAAIAPCGLEIWLQPGDCPSQRDTTAVPATLYSRDVGNVPTVPFSLDLAYLLDRMPDGTCSMSGTTTTMHLCASLAYVAGTPTSAPTVCPTATHLYAPATRTYVYDTKPPAPPTNVSVTSLDSSLLVNFSVDLDTTEVVLNCIPVQVDGGTPVNPPDPHSIDTKTGVRSWTFTGLQNGVTYEVTAVATDALGNKSAASSVSTGTPFLIDDFWRAYQAKKKAETGIEPSGAGCSSFLGVGAVSGCLILLLAIRSRKHTHV